MRLAVIDDHPLILNAMSNVIGSMAAGHEVQGFNDLGAYDDAVATGARFDLALLDLGLLKHSGVSALEYFREWHDDTPVVVLSATRDPETIRRSLALGAMGFIPKISPREVLIAAIELVISGGIYIPREAMSATAPPMDNDDKSALGDAVPASSAREMERRISSLTARQRDVLGQLIKGMPNKLICRQLGMSPNTVKSHLNAIFRALDADNRTQAVIAARAWEEFRVDLRRPGAGGSLAS